MHEQIQIVQQHDGRKSVTLPAGCVGYRRAPASLAVHDETSLLRWCKENLSDAVRVQETVLRSVVLDHVRATGEVANGAELVGGDERFFVGSQKNEGSEQQTSE
jgi:phage host-nuclease inhibitor protein Gam